MSTRFCFECRFFAPRDKVRGHCRRLPPAFEGDGLTDSWPRVSVGDWCGEWKVRPAPLSTGGSVMDTDPETKHG